MIFIKNRVSTSLQNIERRTKTKGYASREKELENGNFQFSAQRFYQSKRGISSLYIFFFNLTFVV